jgi:hypothetical protein
MMSDKGSHQEVELDEELDKEPVLLTWLHVIESLLSWFQLEEQMVSHMV